MKPYCDDIHVYKYVYKIYDSTWLTSFEPHWSNSIKYPIAQLVVACALVNAGETNSNSISEFIANSCSWFCSCLMGYQLVQKLNITKPQKLPLKSAGSRQFLLVPVGSLNLPELHQRDQRHAPSASRACTPGRPAGAARPALAAGRARGLSCGLKFWRYCKHL